MHSKRPALRVGLVIFAAIMFATSADAASDKVLYNLNSYSGGEPVAGLIFGGDGNLYGTASVYGYFYLGTVFELSLDGRGEWTAKALHRFGNDSDGISPEGGVVFDSSGNLYGTTSRGGTGGGGIVFELSSDGGPFEWKETVLYNFSGSDGKAPKCGLIWDAAGDLYGTTSGGGSAGNGTVFELSPNGSGGWTEKVLYSFGAGQDGKSPQASLIFDSAGNLYGTTFAGGTMNGGTVFQLTPTGGGGWAETVLFNFGLDGPVRSSLILDGGGNLYGTTVGTSGPAGKGTVFRLNRREGWSETVLHTFSGPDGAAPEAGVTFDRLGNLYGTTSDGGTYKVGTVFMLEPNARGGYDEKVLHSFLGSYSIDGGRPWAGVIFDAAGNLYGTTRDFGLNFSGTVFQVTR